MIWNEKEMSSLSDEKCKGNVEGWGEVICNRYAKGGRKKSENSKTEGGLAVTGNKFIYKQAMYKKQEELCLRSQAVAVANATSRCEQMRACPLLLQPPSPAPAAGRG